MNDKKLKDMWNKAEYFMGTSEYESGTIERFLSGRSKSIAAKLSKLLQVDIGIKILIMLVLICDVFVYMNVQQNIAIICAVAVVAIIPIILFENNVLNQFENIKVKQTSTKEGLLEMMAFWQSKRFVTLLSTASTYLFGFNAGILLYFFAEYGQLRRMGSLDLLVFPAICLIGIIMNVKQNNSTIQHQLKHIELCLSDLNEDLLPLVSHNIEVQQKNDHKMNIMVAIVVLLAFLVFVAILKEMGF